MNSEFRVYKFAHALMTILVGTLYRLNIIGFENIPNGAALVCANHSSWLDPLIVAVSLKNKEHLHMMAKKELFRIKMVGAFLRGIGSFPVDRSENDIVAVRTTMRYLKNSEKVLVFPEGTRCRDDNEINAKSGAVRIAEKMNVPIVPICIPRRKKLFRRLDITIGKPFFVNPDGASLQLDDYAAIANDMMAKINSLQSQKELC